MKKLAIVSMFLMALSVVQAEEFLKMKKEGVIAAKQGHIYLPKDIVLPIKLIKFSNSKTQVEEYENNFKVEANKIVELNKEDTSFSTVNFKSYKKDMNTDEILKAIELKKCSGVEEYLLYRRLFMLEGKKSESKSIELVYQYFKNNKKYLEYTMSLPEYGNIAYTYHPLFVLSVVKNLTFTNIMTFGKANAIDYQIKSGYEEELFYEIALRKMQENDKNITDILAAMKYMVPQNSFNNILKKMDNKKEFSAIVKYLKVLGENNFEKNIEYIKTEKNTFLVENMLSELIISKEDCIKYKAALKKKNIIINPIFEYLPQEEKMQEYNTILNISYATLQKKYSTGGIYKPNQVSENEEKFMKNLSENKYEYQIIDKDSNIDLITQTVYANLYSIFGQLYELKKEVGAAYPETVIRTLEILVDNALKEKGTASEYQKLYLVLGLQKITDACIERMPGVRTFEGVNFQYLDLYDKIGKNTEFTKNSRVYFIDIQSKRIATMLYSIGTDSEFTYTPKNRIATMEDIEKEVKQFKNIFPDGVETLEQMLDRMYSNALKNKEIYKDEVFEERLMSNIEIIRKILN